MESEIRDLSSIEIRNLMLDTLAYEEADIDSEGKTFKMYGYQGAQSDLYRLMEGLAVKRGRIVDIGLRNYLLGFRDMDTGHMIENVVYFELLRRGYDVATGKVGDKEVDFIATSAVEKKYIQVTETVNDSGTRERELAPLRAIRDNYEKVVIANDIDFPVTQDGINIVKLTDFLINS